MGQLRARDEKEFHTGTRSILTSRDLGEECCSAIYRDHASLMLQVAAVCPRYPIRSAVISESSVLVGHRNEVPHPEQEMSVCLSVHELAFLSNLVQVPFMAEWRD